MEKQEVGKEEEVIDTIMVRTPDGKETYKPVNVRPVGGHQEGEYDNRGKKVNTGMLGSLVDITVEGEKKK